jgi:RNA polymerase sigma-70 factor (ECF subfamily)
VYDTFRAREDDRMEPDVEDRPIDPEQAFVAHRNLLFTVAYDMLSTVGDAEDVVQDVWLRWRRVDHSRIENPRSYMVRIAVRCSLERLRQLRKAREDYVGPWLPEPLLASPDPADDLPDHGRIAIGMLVVLETLSPLERTAFVLHDVFGFGHAEIAGILHRSPTAVRQLVHRAREHVQARRPRFDADPDTARAAAERFVEAAVGGSIAGLLEVLAPDVVLHNDGGGVVRAALHPIRGADKLARLFAHIGPQYSGLEYRWTFQGGTPTAVGLSDGVPRVVLSIDTDPTGRVTAIYGNLNPDKIAHLPVG